MTHSDLARLEGLVANIGPLPIDPIWMYEVIRHAQRNMDFDVAEGFCEPDRYAGSPIGELINELPAILARVRELESALSSIHAARLRKDGSDHGYGWNITALNRAVDAALPLIGKQAPPLDPRTAHIAENADRIAQQMGCRFNLNKENPDADR